MSPLNLINVFKKVMKPGIIGDRYLRIRMSTPKHNGCRNLKF